MKRLWKWVVSILGIIVGALFISVYLFLNRTLDLSQIDKTTKVEIYTVGGQKHLISITEKQKIRPICDFVQNRKQNWQLLLETPASNDVSIIFYSSSKINLTLFLNYYVVIARVKDADFTASFDRKDIDAFLGLLGVNAEMCGLKMPKN